MLLEPQHMVHKACGAHATEAHFALVGVYCKWGKCHIVSCKVSHVAEVSTVQNTCSTQSSIIGIQHKTYVKKNHHTVQVMSPDCMNCPK